MKKITILILLFGLSFQFSSCKSEPQKEVITKKIAPRAAFSLETADNSIDWVAYKTTDKVPVKGKFKKVTITKKGEGNTAKEAIDGAEFSIPVSSLFTADSGRDYKLKKFFFGVMENTKLLAGSLKLSDDTNGVADITMNGVTASLPFTYELKNKKFVLSATMNLENWNAQEAINSINTVCKALHTGTDGISKTWSEVAINITSTFQ
jgi:hypothetical protein